MATTHREDALALALADVARLKEQCRAGEELTSELRAQLTLARKMVYKLQSKIKALTPRKCPDCSEYTLVRNALSDCQTTDLGYLCYNCGYETYNDDGTFAL